MADDEIVVELDKETPITTDAAKAVEQKTAPADAAIEDLKQQHETLKADAERERSDRIAAQQRADAERQARVAAEQQLGAAKTEITDSRLGTVEQGIAAAKNEADAAEAAWADAQEKGDWKRAAAEQRKMANAEARMVQLESAKADLEIQKAQPRQQTIQRQPTESDIVEQFLSGCKPGTRDWLRNHPDEAKALALDSNPRRRSKLNAAHADAIAEGYEDGSSDYIAHVEKFLGMTKKEGPATNGKTNGKVEVAAHTRKAPAATVAPVSASSGGVNGGENVVKLTQGEAQAAQDGTHVWNYDDPSDQKRFKKGDPIGIQEFARRKKAMQDQGLYDRTLVTQ